MASHEDLISLCGKQNAVPIFDDNSPDVYGNKRCVDFTCECGERATSQLRNIRKSGARCKACMKVQKSKNITQSKRKDRGEITDPAKQRRCNGVKCGYVKDISEFVSERKPGKFTKLCKSCRDKVTDHQKQKKQKAAMQADDEEELEVEMAGKKCTLCNERQPLEKFVNRASGKETQACLTCREKVLEQERKRKEKLLATPAEEGETKCTTCLQNRPYSLFPVKDGVPVKKMCNVCLKNAEHGVELKRRARKAEFREEPDVAPELLNKKCFECDTPFTAELAGDLMCEFCASHTECKKCNEKRPNEEFVIEGCNTEEVEVCSACRNVLPEVLIRTFRQCATCQKVKGLWDFDNDAEDCDRCARRKKDRKETLDEIITFCGATLISNVAEDVYIQKGTRIEYECYCGVERTKSFDTTKGYGAFCKEHQHERVQAKRKFFVTQKYGVLNGVSPVGAETLRNTMLKKYGVSSFFKTQAYKDSRIKFHETYLKELMNQSGATLVAICDLPLTRYSNVKYVCKCGSHTQGNFTVFHKNQRVQCLACGVPEAKEKKKKTMLERYGVENASQHPDLLAKRQKSSFETYVYTMPSGKQVYIQGYENFALDEVFSSWEVDEENVAVAASSQDIPRIEYVFDGKKSVYHPDIFIKNENFLIEVKSIFTYKKQLARNEAKKQACLEQGYNFDFWVYDKNGKRLFEIE